MFIGMNTFPLLSNNEKESIRSRERERERERGSDRKGNVFFALFCVPSLVFMSGSGKEH